jgi:hypothetical protein
MCRAPEPTRDGQRDCQVTWSSVPELEGVAPSTVTAMVAADASWLDDDLRAALFTSAAGWRDRDSTYSSPELATVAVLLASVVGAVTCWSASGCPAARQRCWVRHDNGGVSRRSERDAGTRQTRRRQYYREHHSEHGSPSGPRLHIRRATDGASENTWTSLQARRFRLSAPAGQPGNRQHARRLDLRRRGLRGVVVAVAGGTETISRRFEVQWWLRTFREGMFGCLDGRTTRCRRR